MGKTKTAFVTGTGDEALSSKEKYLLKQKKKQEEEAKQKAQVGKVGLKGGERIKVVSAEPIEEVKKEEETTTTKKRVAKIRGKNYKAAKKKVNKTKLYKLTDAIKLVKDTSYSKFNGTVEMHLVIKKTGFSSNVTLPHSFGKAKKVEVADDKTVEKLKKGTVDFDVLLATAEMMPKLVPFARILGPKGLMPNPKTGTLIKSKKDAEKFSGNSITIKTERKQPVIHTAVGKVDQKDSELTGNIEEILKAVGPKQVTKAYLTSTMGPSVKLKV